MVSLRTLYIGSVWKLTNGLPRHRWPSYDVCIVLKGDHNYLFGEDSCSIANNPIIISKALTTRTI